MKIYDLDPEIIVKVNINCSDACPRKLEKYLMEISGVYTVDMDPEKNLVTIRGNVDPMIVLKVITETGHSAELWSYKKEPKIEEDEKWSKKGKKHVRLQTGREKRKHGHARKHHHHHHPKKGDYDHKVEDFIPPKIDPDISKDPFCEHHRRRPIITEEIMPPWESTGLPRDHAHGFLCDHGSPFDYLHPRMPPDACGLNFGSPLHGFNKFTYFGYEYARGCTIM